MRVDLSRMTTAAIEAALDDSKQRRPRLSGMRAVAAGAALAVAARAAVKHGPGLPRMPDLSSVPDRVHDRLADRGWLPYEEDEHDDAQHEDQGYDDDPSAEGDDDVDEDEDDDDVDGHEDGDISANEEDAGGEDDDLDGPQAEAEKEDELDEDDDLDDLDDEPEAAADDGDGEDVDEEPDAEAGQDDEIEEPDEVEDDEVEQPDEARNGRRTAEKARPVAPRLEVPPNAAAVGNEVPGVLALLSARRSRPPVMSRRRRASRVDPASRPPEPPERESETKAGSRK